MNCGIGIRPELFEPVSELLPTFGFLEAHSENYFGESIARKKLLELREHYPISLHGVGLSLGRADDLSRSHLNQLKELVNLIEPILVSEHLAWSAYSHRHVPDLLPLPLTEDALDVMCTHVDEMQTALGRQILVENPSNYLVFDQLQMSEPEFLNKLAERTGCGLLVDVNNIHVSAINVQRDSRTYLDALDSNLVHQYHLAGYTEVSKQGDGREETVLIDTHNQTVYDPVWELYQYAIDTHGACPTLFEWDSDFPEFEVLEQECEKANLILSRHPMRAVAQQPRTIKSRKQKGSLGNQQAAFLDQLLALDNLLLEVREDYQYRISVYQNNVFAALQDYLAEVYPASRGVVGNDFFKQVAQRLIQERPPAHGNVHLYGAEFKELLNTLEGLENLPYLGSLIDYEWSIHTAFFAETSKAINPNSIAQEELLTLPVAYNPSVFLLDTGFPIYEIHRQSLPSYEGDVSIDLSQSQDSLLIYKTDHEVHQRQLSDQEFILLNQIKKSENLLQAIEALQGSISPEAMSSTLALVFDAQLLQRAT